MSCLSAQNPRWSPESEQDLQQAIDDGLLEETHYLDVKRELAAGKPAANKELARDLAQFAIDGGLLLVGIEEDKQTTAKALAPVVLSGLPERIENIARTAIDPPLPVTTQVINSDRDPSRGYVLVDVPRSGLAPHMVDGIYIGRGDKSKIRLSDQEVLRLHAARGSVSAVANAELDRYVARDPIPSDLRKQAHLFLVAMPDAPRSEMLLDAVHGSNWRNTFSELKSAAFVPQPLMADHRFSPDLSFASRPSKRSDGAAFASPTLTPDRQLELVTSDAFSEDIIELEMSEDGVVRLFNGRISDWLSSE